MSQQTQVDFFCNYSSSTAGSLPIGVNCPLRVRLPLRNCFTLFSMFIARFNLLSCVALSVTTGSDWFIPYVDGLASSFHLNIPPGRSKPPVHISFRDIFMFACLINDYYYYILYYYYNINVCSSLHSSGSSGFSNLAGDELNKT